MLGKNKLKQHSLCVINAQFKFVFNAAETTQVLNQRLPLFLWAVEPI